MIQILRTEDKPIDADGQMVVPAMMIPSFKILRAKELGTEQKFMIRTQGGLGDIICAEPAIRWAIKEFKDTEFTIDSYWPELFSHLEVPVNDTKKKIPDYEKYIVFDTMHHLEHLSWEFIAHMFTHVVDCASLTMWKSQLPISDRVIQLVPTKENFQTVTDHFDPYNSVVVHCGRTWQSRTIPGWFWTKVIDELKYRDVKPIIIGKESYGMTGSVVIDTQGCVDLRNKLSVMETVALLQSCKVLLTNDSSPIHMAASGNAWIGFISTVKHPEHITHWRNNDLGKTEFGWKMQNWSKGWLNQNLNMCPTSSKDIRVDSMSEEQLNSFLPDPKEYANWAAEKLKEKA